MTSVPRHMAKFPVILCLIITCTGIILLFIPWDNIYHSRSQKLIWNFGHVPLFAAMSYLLMFNTRGFVSRIFEIRVIILVVLALIAGVSIEIIQLSAGRQFSIQDVYFDIIGACLVPAVVQPTCDYLTRYSLPVLRVLAGVCLFTVLFPLAVSLLDEYRAYRQFPVLADFESPLELGRFGDRSRLRIRDHDLEVRFGTEQYSGFSLKYFPGDWSGYSSLIMEVKNSGNENVYLTCRINDQFHDQSYGDRYNRRFTVLPGFNTIEINLEEVKNSPSNRKINMEKIGGLGCFTVRLQVPAILVIKKITLI